MEQQLERPVDFTNYLKRTPILDFDSLIIRSLIQHRGWEKMASIEKIKHIYNYVRDEVKFGYNIDDNISASQVLTDGYGQCNTKANLFMALLRAVGVPNRMHGFTIHKALQKGAVTGLWYTLSPKNILHSWVEVYLEGEWFNLEGIILDKLYLRGLQNKFADCKITFCGYGAYTDNLKNPPIDWGRNHTYIQDKGINQDFGLYNSPDDLYATHQQQMNPVKRWFFRNYVRHLMNQNVERIRSGS